MKAALLLSSGLLIMQLPVEPPVEYQATEPLTVQVTFADPVWVNAECTRRVGRVPDPGMVFEACAGVGEPWAIVRHGRFYPGDRMGVVLEHEVAHVRGWYHG